MEPGRFFFVVKWGRRSVAYLLRVVESQGALGAEFVPRYAKVCQSWVASLCGPLVRRNEIHFLVHLPAIGQDF